MVPEERSFGLKTDRAAALRFIDGFLLFCLCVLVIFLPVAHTETIRAFSIGIPLGLWAVKMFVNRRALFSRTPADWALLLFTVVAALSVATAVDWRYSLEEFFGEWVLGVLLFYLVVSNVRPGQVKYILFALLAGNILMLSYGIYDFQRAGGELLSYKVRAGSLHSGFGTFATYLLTVLPYILAGVFLTREKTQRLLLALLAVLNFICLYLTHSRGSWVAAAVLVLLIGWRFLPRRTLLICAGLAGLGFFLLAPPGILRHDISIPGPATQGKAIETGGARWELTKFSLEEIRKNPFRMLGFGQRSFVKKFREFYLSYKGAQFWHAHNTFLNLALQTGVQGLVLFCFFLYRILGYYYRKSRQAEDPLLGFLSLAAFIMVISFFVRNLSDDFFADDSALLFWFLAGLALTKTGGAPLHPGRCPADKMNKRKGGQPPAWEGRAGAEF
jgi:putative inorganic carbon (HCO3(-)) transporter